MYYPLLKNSNNEMKAIRELKEATKSSVIPIIESKRIKYDSFENWQGSFNTLGRYLSERLSKMNFIYDFNCALDEIGIEEEFTNEKGENLVEFCISKMKEYELELIPCFQHDSPTWLIQSVVNSGYDKIAIRIRCHSFKESFDSYVFEKLTRDLAEKHNLSITVILDFYNVPTQLDRINNAIKTFSALPNSEIIFLSTSCPEDASDAEVHSITLVASRKDLNNYLELKKLHPSLLFGDYTTRLQGEVLAGFNHNNSYLKIFYTSETDYYIAKSRLIKDGGEDTFHEVCHELTEQDFYSGNEFSFGDNEIYRCSIKEITISTHQAPIAIAVNHHIELTVAQLFN